MADGRLSQHLRNAGLSYIFTGGRLHGSAVSPIVSHIGNKMAKVGAIGRLAYKGFNVLKQSFSQKEKQMAPVKHRRPANTAGKPKVGKRKNSSAGSNKSKRQRQMNVPKKMKKAAAYRFVGTLAKGTKRLTAKTRFEKQGVSYTWEATGTFDNNLGQLLIAGHATCPAYNTQFIAHSAILKALFQKMGVQLISFEDALKDLNFLDGDQFQYLYHRNATDGIVASVVTVGTPAMTTVYDLLVNITNTFLGGVSGASYTNDSFRMIEAVYIPVAIAAAPASFVRKPRTELDLKGAKIELYCKSDFKFQNQSVTLAADNQADDVNNVPIYGKTYEGSGCGFKIMTKRTAGIGQLGDQQLINVDNYKGVYVVGGNTWGLYEPVQRKELQGVKTSGKVGLNPGEIKNSQLISQFTITIDRLFKECLQFDPTTGGLETRPKMNIGKYRFLMLEKVIGLTGETGVKIAYEHNYYLAGIYKKGVSPATRMGFTVI